MFSPQTSWRGLRPQPTCVLGVFPLGPKLRPAMRGRRNSAHRFIGGCPMANGMHKSQRDDRDAPLGSTEGDAPSASAFASTLNSQGEGPMRRRRRRGSPTLFCWMTIFRLGYLGQEFAQEERKFNVCSAELAGGGSVVMLRFWKNPGNFFPSGRILFARQARKFCFSCNVSIAGGVLSSAVNC